jgi:hypothetical protein
VGQAKNRGSYSERVALAQARKADEQKRIVEIAARVEKRIADSGRAYPEGMLPAGLLATLALSMGIKKGNK